MRVAFVLGTTSGGTGRHVRMLVEGLVRREHQVAVVGPGSVEESFAFRAAGARFAEVPVSDRPHPLNDLRAVLGIRRVTRDADVVHAHGLRAGALATLALRPLAALRSLAVRRPAASPGPSARRAPSTAVTRAGAAGREARGDGEVARREGGPGSGGVARRGDSGRLKGRRGRRVLVVTLHNALTAAGFVGFVYGVLERIVARGADHVLVVSPDLGERMTALGARSVAAAVVPAPALRPARRTPEEVREGLGAAERPVVLTIGRLAQQKGLDTLLDVAAGPWEPPQPLFAIAGEGPLRGELQAAIEERGLPVVLLGNRDDVPDLLGAAAAVVTASRWEGLPLNLSEALMAGRPVIASAVGGIPGLVGDAGVLVPYGDAEGIRGALRKVLGDPAYADELARAATRRGRELPEGDDAVESVLGAYRSARSDG